MYESLKKQIDAIGKNFTPGFGETKADEWKLEIRKAEISKKIMDIPELEKIAKAMKTMIDDINSELQENRELTDLQRATLFTKKDAYTWLISLFGDADTIIARITNEIAEEGK